MDILKNMVTTLLTSAIVSTAVSFVLKTWFENRLKHHFQLELEKLRHLYQIELEKLKTELAIKAETVHELSERRLLAYPRIVELVYRTRNMAREIANTTEISQALIEELAARTHELEDGLYAYRIDLQRDRVFVPIHTYKNATITFNKLVRDLSAYKTLGDAEQSNNILAQLHSLYDEMEGQHSAIIEKLSGILPSFDRQASPM